MSVAGTDRDRQESVPLGMGDQPPAPWTAEVAPPRTLSLHQTNSYLKEVDKFSGSEGGTNNFFIQWKKLKF